MVSDCHWFESCCRNVSFVEFGFTGSALQRARFVPGLPSHDRLLGHGCAQTSEYNPTKTPVQSTDSARTQTAAPEIADELAMLVAADVAYHGGEGLGKWEIGEGRDSENGK